MASFKILLEKLRKGVRYRRRVRHALMQFLETVGLYLQAGYDLGYAWPESLKAIGDKMPAGLLPELSSREEEPIGQLLERLANHFSIRPLRVWFSVILELYQSGAGLSHCVSSIANTLRSEHSRDLENHLQRLPSRTNILIILFFLPPTFLLLFYPLLLEVISSLGE